MNAKQAENLRVLIRYMESSKVPELDMAHVRHTCGTPSCAIGHARTIKALGMNEYDRIGDQAQKTFGLSDSGYGVVGWGRLFGSWLLVSKKGGGYVIVEKPTPRQWADEARKVLSEMGYSMDAKPDAFQVFMVKVQEPVALEEQKTYAGTFKEVWREFTGREL